MRRNLLLLLVACFVALLCLGEVPEVAGAKGNKGNKGNNKKDNNNKKKDNNNNNKGGGKGGAKKKDDGKKNDGKATGGVDKVPSPDAVFTDEFFSTVIEGSATPTPLIPEDIGVPPPLPEIDPTKPLTLEDKFKLASLCLSAKDISAITNPADMKAAVPTWNDLNTTLPLAVVQPSSTQEVSDTISCLYSNGVRAVPYSGGCSLMGMSVLPTSVTVDLRYMKNVTLNQDSSLLVQGGATLGDIYSEVFTQSKGIYSVVGASCPALGVGQILGGGIGSLTRMFGLACDQLLGLTIISYDGQILKANPTENQDLFWASCGGGGGNFGIVADYTIKTVNIPPSLTSFDFSVTRDIVPFLMDVQEEISQKADPLFSKLQLTFRNESIDVRGLYLGTEASLAGALNDAGLAAYVEKKSARSQTVNWLDFVIDQARNSNCTVAKDVAGLADRKLTNFGEDVSMNSFLVVESNLFPAAGYEDLFKLKASSKDAFVEIDVLGPKSKVAAVSTPDTAYAFRSALLTVQYGTRWRNKKDDDKNVQLTKEMTSVVDKYLANPQVPREINYLSVQSPNLLGYYGSNLPKLIAVKTQYDPQNYWQNPLGVPSNVDGQFTLPEAVIADVNGDGVTDAGTGSGEVVGPGQVTSASGKQASLGPASVISLVAWFALSKRL